MQLRNISLIIMEIVIYKKLEQMTEREKWNLKRFDYMVPTKIINGEIYYRVD